MKEKTKEEMLIATVFIQCIALELPSSLYKSKLKESNTLRRQSPSKT